MRYLVGLLVVLSFGCAERLNRWPGSGCQPACVVAPIDGDSRTELRAVCLDGNDSVARCIEEGTQSVTCENAGDIATCDTDDGRPRCLGGPVERPVCSR